MKRGTTAFLRHFVRAFPGRSAIIVGLLVLAGFAEGVGVITLLPLLEIAAPGSGDPSRLGRWMDQGFGAVGLQPTLPMLLVLIVIGISMKALLLWTAMRQVGFTMARVTEDLRLKFIYALLRARWRYFTSQSKGHLATAVSSEVQRASAAFREACTIFAQVVQMAVYLAISLAVSWSTTLFAVLGGGFFLVALRRFSQMAREAGQMQTTRVRSLTGRLIDALGGMKPIKAMAKEDIVLPLLERETQGLYEAQAKRVEAGESLKLFQEPLVTLMLAIGLGVAVTLEVAPFSQLLVMAFIFYRLMSHVNTVQMRYQTVVNGESAFWAFQAQMEEAEAAVETAGGEDLPVPDRLRSGIRLAGVGFGYEGRPVLRDVDMSIPAGSFVALVGRSGAGKTTIADLILGLHRPDRGEILIDGRPLADFDVTGWRRQVGYVPQDTLLFHDTILNNVTLADESVTREEVEAALRAADAWTFVSGRPEGMDTVVGEAGGKISGGQRQRIAIARALVGKPALLVLDEATTALDPDTERSICETLGRLKGEVTIISISHQSAMQEAADVVYLVEDGLVTHQEGRVLLPDEDALPA